MKPGERHALIDGVAKCVAVVVGLWTSAALHNWLIDWGKWYAIPAMATVVCFSAIFGVFWGGMFYGYAAAIADRINKK